VNDILDAALAYAAAGWPVFPCAAGGKVPAIPKSAGGNGVLDATTDPGAIRAWWAERPGANIGIATGAPGPDVLDIDVDPDRSGFRALGELRAAGLLDGYGPMIRTRSGGVHVYFRGTGQPCKTLRGKSGPSFAVDFKARGGYVIAPPSYVGADDRGPAGRYEVIEHQEAARGLDWRGVCALLRPAAMFTQAPAPAPAAADGDEIRPGDAWAARTSWAEILAPHGWRQVRDLGNGHACWCRPGKSGSFTSATTREDGGLYVFSTSTEFDTEVPYSKFGALAVLKHGGDQKAAARALAGEGYGTRRPGAAAAASEHPAGADVSTSTDKKGRLVVAAGNVNPVDIADVVAGHLLKANNPPQLFSMGATAVVLDGGRLIPLDGDGWLYYVARRVTFTIGDSAKAIAPPAAVMKLIPSVVIPGLPPLDGITATPYLDRQGSVISAEGYDAGTRLVLHCGGFQIPSVSLQPGDEDVAQAVKLLTGDWLGDFPFRDDPDRANAIAVLLTLTGRMFFALAPLFVFDASTAGSGKGLLVTTISLIATGEPPQMMELPADGEEQRKKITSALLAGNDLIVWDESHVIQGRTLAAILTAERYSDRLLGGNKLISVVNRFTQVALGNNVEVWGDVKRRVVPSRLVPDVEHPEHRNDFRHPDLEEWVRGHRGELLAAVLTIWRNWIAKGRPEAAAGMGSFERWARTVGGALQAAGIGGFRSNTSGWLSDSDDDDGWGNHLADLRGRFGDGWFTVADAAAAVEAVITPLKRPPVRRDPDKTLSEQLGYAYRKIREKWYGDLRLVRSEERNSASGGRQWCVSMRAKPGAPEPSSASSGWSGSADDADHPDDGYRAPEPFAWPEGSIGEEAGQ